MKAIYDDSEFGCDGGYDQGCEKFSSKCAWQKFCRLRAGNGKENAEQRQPTGIELIAAERQRQIEQEGWTPEHDDQHRLGELAIAAACYAIPPSLRLAAKFIGRFWPWDMKWWKPTPEDRKRELVKASALIAAEIDRLQRKGAE